MSDTIEAMESQRDALMDSLLRINEMRDAKIVSMGWTVYLQLGDDGDPSMIPELHQTMGEVSDLMERAKVVSRKWSKVDREVKELKGIL